MASGEPTLSELFDEIWKIYQFLESCDEPTNSEIVQEKVHSAIKKAELGIFMVNELDLFSKNEDIDEVTTNEIQYLASPALLGYFTNKDNSSDRLETVKNSQKFLIDFLKLCKYYNITTCDIPGESTIDDDDDDNEEEKAVAKKEPRKPSKPDLNALQNRRQIKMDRFKHKKETEKCLIELHELVKEEHVADEIKRDYYLTFVKKFINSSVEDLESILEEIPILEHMAKMKKSGKREEPKSQEKVTKKAFRPFILTKNDVQKKVFGAGYPSLPTYTIEEFYDSQVENGNFPGPGEVMDPIQDPNGDREQREREDIVKEFKIENDDPETLLKARNWDDWKDDHRRGWGNRQNMG